MSRHPEVLTEIAPPGSQDQSQERDGPDILGGETPVTTALPVHAGHDSLVGPGPQMIGIAAIPATATDLRMADIEIAGFTMPEAIRKTVRRPHPWTKGRTG
jgi:hypothetical protein